MFKIIYKGYVESLRRIIENVDLSSNKKFTKVERMNPYISNIGK